MIEPVCRVLPEIGAAAEVAMTECQLLMERLQSTAMAHQDVLDATAVIVETFENDVYRHKAKIMFALSSWPDVQFRSDVIAALNGVSDPVLKSIQTVCSTPDFLNEEQIQIAVGSVQGILVKYDLDI